MSIIQFCGIYVQYICLLYSSVEYTCNTYVYYTVLWNIHVIHMFIIQFCGIYM